MRTANSKSRFEPQKLSNMEQEFQSVQRFIGRKGYRRN
jgi:hypothetical protein